MRVHGQEKRKFRDVLAGQEKILASLHWQRQAATS